jgi:uncharacterized repeat protein (TIGR03803 family)
MKTKLKLFAFIAFTLTAALRLIAVQTPQFITIYQFGGVNAIPGAELTLGPNGQLFGTTYGGADADGTGSIYELVPNGKGAFAFNTLYRFDTAYSPANDGQYPDAGLTLSPDGTTLYGTTQQGGSGGGVIFSLNIAQSEGAAVKSGLPQPKNTSAGFIVQHTLNSATDGGAPHGTFVTIHNETVKQVLFFGTCSSYGPNSAGSAFRIAENDNLLESDRVFLSYDYFTPNDGKNPQGKLASGASGRASGSVQKSLIKANVATNIDPATVTLYGITKSGGSNNWGTVYKVDGDGSNYMMLHSFSFSTTDGAGPQGGLVLSGNTLYGTTPGGGNNYAGTVFKINTGGSGFQIIKNFDYATTGYSPQGDLILSGSTLYGTTYAGGMNGGGTVYSINTSGSNFMVLHSFSAPVYDTNVNSATYGAFTNSDGGWSVAGLLLSGYTLYGTTPYGGTNGVGTAYEIILPSPPSLNIAPSGGGVKISWPSSATNFVLQQNPNLATTNWSTNSVAIANDGTNKSISVISTAGNAFFRLFNTNGP